MVKKAVMFALLAMFIVAIISAESIELKMNKQLPSEILIGNNPAFPVIEEDKGLTSLNTVKSASVLNIEVLWPLEGYYYITDFMELALETNVNANCNYNFESSGFQIMETTGSTAHFHIISNLLDNMANTEPYVVDFRCTDGSSTESFASTYFWINTTHLDNFFLRNNLGDWEYFSSELFWSGDEDGFLENYHAYYRINEDGVYTIVAVLIFDSGNSAENFINDYVLGTWITNDLYMDDRNGNNFYSFDDGSLNYALWSNSNKILLLRTYAYENTTPVDISVPYEIIDPYLNKYPSNLEYVACFDNNNCNDGNSHTIDTCNNPGTAESYCDNELIEGSFLIVNSPIDDLFNSRKILIDLETPEEADEINYIDNANTKPREIRLCRNCNEYSRQKSFSDGFHNLTFKAIKEGEIIGEENAQFLVDSRSPRIIGTMPRKGFISETFSVGFKEENPSELILHYGNKTKNADLEEECSPYKKGISCEIDVDLLEFESQEIEYWFELTDIVGNADTSKPYKVSVDTTPPILNDFEYNIGGRRVSFVFGITEDNFDKIIYRDLNDRITREKTLCSRLTDGVCEVTKSFTYGEHNLEIVVLDEAENFVQRNIEFTI